MKNKSGLILLFVLLSPFSLGAMERFALFIGANDGGKDRVKLSYAESDARNIEKVLSRMGGLSENRSVLLKDPTLEEVLTGLISVKQKILAGKSGDRVEFLFYYSGHSDEKGLLLRGDRLEYQELKNQIKDMPGNVKIAILDSCASGVLTRLKGGQHVLPFEMDVSSEARGYAFLTSSAPAESSQESDAIKASFFTHYLTSGLRGAADLNGDGKVSLQEAYQFAFQETLQRTERTKDGPQHPGYDIQMSGAGDLVITDLRGTEARLLLDAPLQGKFFIRDEQGYLTAEINKTAKRQMAIGVEPGNYQITMIQEEKSFSAVVSLQKGEFKKIEMSALQSVSREKSRSRGNDGGGLVDSPFFISFLPGVAFHAASGTSLRPAGAVQIRTPFSLNLLFGRVNEVEGLDLGLFLAWVGGNLSGVQSGSLLGIVGKDVSGVQASGLADFAGGKVSGVQASGLASFAGGNVTGVQASGLASFSGGNVLGVQGAGIFNFAKSIQGLQWAGIFNGVTSRADGLQAAGILNVAGGDMNGVQMGLVNVGGGRVRGLQFGLVNVSSNIEGLPVGLINIVKEGFLNPELWWEDTGTLHAGFKMGPRYFYSVLSIGTEARLNFLETSFGWGGEVPLGRAFLHFEGLAGTILPTRTLASGKIYSVFGVQNGSWGLTGNISATARLSFGFSIYKHLSIQAGLYYRLYWAAPDQPLLKPFWMGDVPKTDWFSHWPGFFVGVQF